jgi:type IX secretion system PorP/SprF family membrane protein
MYLKKILSTILAISYLQGYAQTDIHFSQFYETSILRNPGLTGVFADDYKLSCFYRTQWSSVGTPYNTYLFSGETKVPVCQYGDDFVSFGLLAYRDQSGTAAQRTTSAYPAISYNKSLNPDYNSYLSLGVCAAYTQYSFDPGKITFNNQYQNGAINPSLPSLESIASAKNSFWNLAAGINLNTSSNHDNNVVYCIGVAGYNLTEPPNSYLRAGNPKLNLRGNVNAAVAISLREDIKIQLNGNYARQADFNEIMGAFLWTWNPISKNEESDFSLTLGGIYRYGDAVSPVVKVKYQRAALSASYDVNTSTFSTATNSRGALELSLSISGEFNSQNRSTKTIICPRF